MISKTPENIKRILEAYNKVKDSDIYLASPTPSNLKSKLLDIIDSNDNILETNKVLFKIYFGIKQNEDPIRKIKNSTDSFKTIQNFLIGKTTTIKKEGGLDMVNLFTKNCGKLNSKEALQKIKKEVPFTKVNNFYNNQTFLLGAILLFGFVFAYFLFKYISVYDVTNITINTEQIVVTQENRVIPNQDTKFFNNKNQPQLWYVENNDKIEFYDANGVLEKSNTKLKPVSRQVIETYNTQNNIPIEDNFSQTDTKSSKTTIKKTTVEITYNDRIDRIASIAFKKKYKSNNKKYTCTGNIDYVFRKSTKNSQLVVCDLSLTYKAISNINNEVLDESYAISAGSGFTEEEAKNNALSKMKL